jgi:hypothetical protein
VAAVASAARAHRDVGLSVSTLPEFWFAPEAKLFADWRMPVLRAAGA